MQDQDETLEDVTTVEKVGIFGQPLPTVPQPRITWNDVMYLTIQLGDAESKAARVPITLGSVPLATEGEGKFLGAVVTIDHSMPELATQRVSLFPSHFRMFH